MTLNTKLAVNSGILVLYFMMDAVKAFSAGNILFAIMATAATLTVVYDIVQYYYLRKSVVEELEQKNVDKQ